MHRRLQRKYGAFASRYVYKIIRIFTVDNINRLKHVLECHYRPYGMRSIGCTMYLYNSLVDVRLWSYCGS